MCGIAGFVSFGKPPTDRMLSELVHQAGKRGPHAHGWAWLGHHGWGVIRREGPLQHPPVEMLPSSVIIGHSRLATSGRMPGSVPPVDEAQPITSGDFLLAHNGTIPGSAEAVDSWTLLQALVSRPDQPLAVIEALAEGRPSAFVLGRWRTGRLTLVGAGHPLYIAERSEGVYFCSRSLSDSFRVEDRQTVTLEASWRTEVISPLPMLSGSRGRRSGRTRTTPTTSRPSS